MSPRAILKGLSLIASLALLGLMIKQGHFSTMLSEQWIDAQVRNQGWQGHLAFLTMGALTTAVGFPRQILAFLGGYAFDVAAGTLLGLAASLLGCALAFYYARWFGRGLVARHFPKRIRMVDDFLAGAPFAMTLVIRLLPVTSNLLTNLLAGVTRVKGKPFFAGSALGYVPQTLVFALAGSGVNVDPVLRLTLAGLLFVASSLLGVWLYHRHRHGLALEAELDAALGDSQPCHNETDRR